MTPKTLKTAFTGIGGALAGAWLVGTHTFRGKAHTIQDTTVSEAAVSIVPALLALVAKLNSRITDNVHSYHEASHILMDIHHPSHYRLSSAKLERGLIKKVFWLQGGAVSFTKKSSHKPNDLELSNHLKCRVGGRIGEKFKFGPKHNPVGYGEDYEAAFALAQEIVGNDGTEAAVQAEIREAEVAAYKTLTENSEQLEILASLLRSEPEIDRATIFGALGISDPELM